MRLVSSLAELRAALADARADGGRVALVPTMGFLHEGHLRLCDVAREHAVTVALSIYVNPLQFGAGEDLDRYPRDLQRDSDLAAARGVDLLFTPDTRLMYPDGDARVRIHAPGLDDRLCGRFRPGHFEGVLTVVAKLFNMVEPDVAVFGRKDLQQLLLIQRMVRDLDFGVEIVGAPIVRDADGLALSSRNVYLSAAERTAALALPRSLDAVQRAFSGGERDPPALVDVARAILAAEAGVSPQYVELVDTVTLGTPFAAAAGNAVAVAAHVGATRLIDNHVLT